ncbi:MAG: glycosyltransferase family 39 protein [Chloroflexota bacterium]
MVDLAPLPTRARSSAWPVRLLEVAALLGVSLLALRLRTSNLDAYTGSFDEGIRAQQLLLMSAGYRPFQDIFASQGPLLLDLLYPFYLLFGQTLAAARGGVVVCGMVAILGSWWVARQVGGPCGGLAAALLLGLSPSFLEGSRLALAEVPTIAPALLALGSLLAYRQRPARWLLVLSAAWCALSVLIKPMALPVGAPLAVLLLMPASTSISRGSFFWPWRRAITDLLLYGAVFGAICAVVIMILGPAGVWDNLGAYRTGAGSSAGANASSNLRLTFNIMRQEQPGLYILVAVGTILGLWRRPAVTLAVLAWGAAVLGMFIVYGDLADKHIVYLLPPVALLAACGAGLGAEEILSLIRRARIGRPGLQAALPALASLLGLAAYLVTLPAIYRADRYLLREAPRVAAERRDRAADQEIAETIRTHTPPDGWVLADNPLAAYEARRMVIPYLVDTSGTRVDAGSLTAPLAEAYVQRYQPSVIVTWPRRLGKLDAFVERLPALGYRLEKSYPIGWKVYVLQ